MKTIRIFYWVSTLLFAAQMLYDAVLDLMPHQEAVAAFAKMNMPAGMLAFYGVVKLIAGLIILLPVTRSLKEWAYAILIFTIAEATYAMATAGFDPAVWALMAIPFMLGLLSYIFWRLSNKLTVQKEKPITITVTPTSNSASYRDPLQQH